MITFIRNKFVLFLTLLFLSFLVNTQQDLEYLTKASYIEKFARFIQWPNETDSDEFTIIIFGKSPIQNSLEKLAKSVKIKNKIVRIVRSNNIDDITKCNILFISSSEEKRISRILLLVQDLPVLTIAQTQDFCDRGGHINFYDSQEGSIYYEINPNKIKQAGLKADLFLIQNGRVVKN